MKLQQAPGGTTATECRAFTSSGSSYEEAPGLQKQASVGSIKKKKKEKKWANMINKRSLQGCSCHSLSK